MKSSLVMELISAHASGNEEIFKTAIENLAYDEEKKGNRLIATNIREAYEKSGKKSVNKPESPISEMTFGTQSMGVLPKDKDSTLELLEVYNSKVNLDNVALPENTLNVINQIISEQKAINQLVEGGVMPSNRILLCGPPGCGKTLTANAIAGELKIPIAYVKLDGLVSSYLGQTGSNIRRIFDFVKDKRIILFLDEFDAIAKKRDDSQEVGELKRVVTTLLQNMDLMPANVLLIAATNHHQLLDKAIWRRFDQSILLENPNSQQRRLIIDIFLNNIKIDISMDTEMVTILSEGMSGAELRGFLESLVKRNIMNEMNGKIDQEMISNVWLQQKTLFISRESEDFYLALLKLKNNGVSLRTLERITGIAKSTIDYNLKKGESLNVQ